MPRRLAALAVLLPLTLLTTASCDGTDDSDRPIPTVDLTLQGV